MDTKRLTGAASGGVLAGLLLGCFLVAALGGLATVEGVREWYPGLDKPPWTPPNAAFGPIWTVLYTAMAVAAWDVVRRDVRGAYKPMLVFGAQLLLNAMWSPVFFAWHLLGLSLVIISALWVSIAACVVLFWESSRVAAGLMAVYLAWVSIAWSLNAWVWWFNP